MKTKHLICLAVFCGFSSSLHAQTPPLTPSGPPSDPTTAMKSLNQVEPRTPIGSLPFTITQPGSYYFTGNLEFTSASGDAITVSADNVTIDLNGFTLSSTAPVTGSAIKVPSSGHNTVVTNGTIKGSTSITDTGVSWIATNEGFTYGLWLGKGTVSRMTISNCRENGLRAAGRAHVSDVLVTKSGQNGIVLFSDGELENVRAISNRGGASGFTSAINCEFSFNHTVGGSGADLSSFFNCRAAQNGSSGISTYGGLVSNCIVVSNDLYGISAIEGVVTGCKASNNGTDAAFPYGYGIRCDDGTVTNCVVIANKTGIVCDNGIVSGCVMSGNTIADFSGTGTVRIGNNPAP